MSPNICQSLCQGTEGEKMAECYLSIKCFLRLLPLKHINNEELQFFTFINKKKGADDKIRFTFKLTL